MTWTLQRIAHALLLSPGWLFGKIKHPLRVVRLYSRFRKGDISGLSTAPASSKWGVVPIRHSGEILSSHLLSNRHDIWETSQEIKDSRGVWPISFSYPRNITVDSGELEKRGFICPTFPGHRYRFDAEDQYLDNYRGYEFGLTHKKGGWDCFRHLEIMFAGAVPFMPDARHIPQGTMVHYPKAFITEVAQLFARGRPTIAGDVRAHLAEFFNENLTTKAMASYVLKACGLTKESKILFVDGALNKLADYQSVFTLIGLKQLMGTKIEVSHSVPYLYSDWQGDSSTLYGRGFGYSRILDPDLKSTRESLNGTWSPDHEALVNYDAIILGSVTRNREVAYKLLKMFPPEGTIWIHGEDQGPEEELVNTTKKHGVTLFVRELS